MKLFIDKFEKLTRDVPLEKKHMMYAFYVGKVKCPTDIHIMEIAIELENISNKACDDIGIEDPLRREQFITNAIVCNMMKMSSERDINKYFNFIRELGTCMKEAEKSYGLTILSNLLCMVASKISESKQRLYDH